MVGETGAGGALEVVGLFVVEGFGVHGGGSSGQEDEKCTDKDEFPIPAYCTVPSRTAGRMRPPGRSTMPRLYPALEAGNAHDLAMLGCTDPPSPYRGNQSREPPELSAIRGQGSSASRYHQAKSAIWAQSTPDVQY
jgi:hypothetical protein